MFRDEAASWFLTTYPLPEILERVATEPYPPLYPVLLQHWVAIFGDSEAGLRSFSVTAAMVTLVAGWRWAHEALGRAPGLVALVILVFSPLAISNARDVRMYALESAFATVAWWLVWRLASGRVPGRGPLTLHSSLLAVAIAGELWTLSLGLVIAGLQGLVVLVALFGRHAMVRPVRPDLPRRESEPRQVAPALRVAGSARGAAWALVAVAVGCLSFVPWLPQSLSLAANGERFWTPPPGPLDWASTLARMVVGWREDIPNAVDLSLVILSVGALGLVVLLHSRHEARRVAGWCVLAGVGVVALVWAVSLVRSIFDTRYFAASVPPLALAVGAGVGALVAWAGDLVAWAGARYAPGAPRAEGGLRTPAGFVRAGLFLSALTLALLLDPFVRVWLKDWRDGRDVEPARQLLAAVAPRLGPDDVLLARDARTYFPIAYHIRRSGGHPIPASTPLLAFDSGNEPFYRGNALIEEDVLLRRSETDRGWRGALSQLGRDGDVWLLDLAFDDDEDRRFEPIEEGEVQELEELVVDTTEREGTARRLAVP